MSRKIKWGVIGSGGIARRRTIPEGILKADNAELTTVFDIDSSVNAEVAKKFSAKQAASISDLLDANKEAVYIATPAHLHSDQVRACAKAGKN
jgi:predicted dehydrogenase